MAIDQTENAGEAQKRETSQEPACFLCGRKDNVVALLAVRQQGRSEWVCVRCLPRLIHG